MMTKPDTIKVGNLYFSDGINTCTLAREFAPGEHGERIDVYSHIYFNGSRGAWTLMFEATYTNTDRYTRSLGAYDTESEAIRAGEYALRLRDTP